MPAPPDPAPAAVINLTTQTTTNDDHDANTNDDETTNDDADTNDDMIAYERQELFNENLQNSYSLRMKYEVTVEPSSLSGAS